VRRTDHCTDHRWLPDHFGQGAASKIGEVVELQSRGAAAAAAPGCLLILGRAQHSLAMARTYGTSELKDATTVLQFALYLRPLWT
jgi:uncharacterized membrane protein (DUF4010 family)